MESQEKKIIIYTLILVVAVQTATLIFLSYKVNYMGHSLARNDAVINDLYTVVKLHSNGVVNATNILTETYSMLDCLPHLIFAAGISTIIFLYIFRV